MTIEEYLAVPYRLVAYAALTDQGLWKRRAEYPEINTYADADTLVDAIEELEQRRVDFIVDSLIHDRSIPVPRPPLRSVMEELDRGEVREISDRIASGIRG